MSKKPKFTADHLEFALESAAGFLEAEEWPEDDGGAQVAAYQEAAKRIRAMVDRSVRRSAKVVAIARLSKSGNGTNNPWGLKLKD